MLSRSSDTGRIPSGMLAAPMRLVGYVLIAALAFGCTAALPTRALAEKIRIGVPTLTADSAFFILALQKGYFAQEGLDVEVVSAGDRGVLRLRQSDARLQPRRKRVPPISDWERCCLSRGVR
jgi:hypothetical protein